MSLAICLIEISLSINRFFISLVGIGSLRSIFVVNLFTSFLLAKVCNTKCYTIQVHQYMNSSQDFCLVLSTIRAKKYHLFVHAIHQQFS